MSLSGSARIDVAPLAGRVAPLALAGERVLSVVPALQPLFPEGGIVRGRCLACVGSAGVSTALALMAQATSDGHWAAITGIAAIGASAAAEMGVALERLVVVPGAPAHDPGVLSALIDGFEVLVVGGADRVSAAAARRLQARAQTRGVILVVVGSAGRFTVDVEVRGDGAGWEGLGDGFGRLLRRRVALQASGRRVPRPRRCVTWLPGPQGGIEPADPIATVAPADPLLASAVGRDASELALGRVG